MRYRGMLVVIAGAALAAVAAPSALAQAVVCCGVTYGVAAPPLAYPPTPYILNPSDARAPFYVVNQGPVYKGPGIFSVPTYSEGGYAFAPYPYVYAPAYGYGPPPYVRPSYRPYGAPPYGAYFHRPAPSARVIHMRRRYGDFRPPVRRPPPSHHVAPSERHEPQMAPPLPPPRPGKPAEEQWTKGVPR